MILRPLLTISIALLLLLSCESGARLTPIEDHNVTVVLKPTASSLVEAPDRVAEAAETQIASRKDPAHEFQHAQFVNKQKGWASTNNSIYTISDGGQTWERLPFKPPENSRISSFSFVDESHGWLAVAKQVHNERYGLGNSSTIFASSDGGRTWTEQANFLDEVTIKEISFLDANRGLAVGARTVDQPRHQDPAYEEMLILSTENGGDTWTDISESVKTALLRQKAGPGDSGWSVRWISATEIFLLTRSGRVLQSVDSAATWKSIVSFKDERPNGTISSTSYYKMIFDPEKRIRVIGGAMGTEGFWGDLIVNSNNSWTSYELVRTPIIDAVFLSANEVLASGMEIPHVDDKSASGPTGVILQSLDSGKSWTTIYRSKAEEMFISLTKMSDREFYAVSDAGTFLKFSLKGL
jgi:photosystem II stability/assembly factor-like uncharacterized protein